MAAGVLSRVLPTTFVGSLTAVVLLYCIYQILQYGYNLFIHPLRRFPGPVSAACSDVPLLIRAFKGRSTEWIAQLHQQYGDVVRVAPGELSFSSADAWRDIYGHKKVGLPTLEKQTKFYDPPGGMQRNLVSAGFQDHSRIRRIFSNAFSDQALKLQEPMFLVYVNRLVQKLRDGLEDDPERKFNMVSMYNFTTFDVMGDLAFGEPLDMLSNNSYHPWVSAIFAGVKFGVYLHAIRTFTSGVEIFLLRQCVPKSLQKEHKLNQDFCAQRVDRRVEKGSSARPDIWGLVLAKEGPSGLTKAEMHANASLFMIAGTETTATLLSGLTYLLLSNPDKMVKLTKEIRSAFANEDEITIERLQTLKYLHGCLEEGLRLYPPVPTGLPRVTPPQTTTMIAGKEVPSNTSVYVTSYAAFRNPDNFGDPDAFIPERWLPDSTVHDGDKKYAFQPFSLGPRGCLGKNMAYHEMRIILTKVLYNFDLSLCKESQGWDNQKVFILWEKGPLYCKLKPVKRAS